MHSTKIFITGATGYLGGTIVSRLLAHPEAKSFDLTALVRTPEKAGKFNTLGIKTVIGGYADLERLTDSARRADAVIAVADSDNLAAADAILKGLKQRYEETGDAPILIHTSGTAIIADDARGQHGDHRTYSDLESDAIEAIPGTIPHRNVDIALVGGDNEGYVKAYIITPGTVFGPTEGYLADVGIQHKHSVQIPALVKASIARKKAGFIGAGKNVWSAVSNRDTADLYITLFDAVRESTTSAGHGRDGFYFAESFEYSGYDVAEETGKVLAELGISKSAEPTQYTKEECVQYFGDWWPILSSNSRARGDRSRALGWKPVDGKDAFIRSIRTEVLEVVGSLQHEKL